MGLAARTAQAAAIRNDLVLEAAKRYWEWTYASRNLVVTAEALELAEIGFELVKASYEAGDKAATEAAFAAADHTVEQRLVINRVTANTIEPRGSANGRPQPIAAAIGSSIR